MNCFHCHITKKRKLEYNTNAGEGKHRMWLGMSVAAHKKTRYIFMLDAP
jgi:hypothetical protein